MTPGPRRLTELDHARRLKMAYRLLDELLTPFKGYVVGNMEKFRSGEVRSDGHFPIDVNAAARQFVAESDNTEQDLALLLAQAYALLIVHSGYEMAFDQMTGQ